MANGFVWWVSNIIAKEFLIFENRMFRANDVLGVSYSQILFISKTVLIDMLGGLTPLTWQQECRMHSKFFLFIYLFFYLLCLEMCETWKIILNHFFLLSVSFWFPISRITQKPKMIESSDAICIKKKKNKEMISFWAL